MTLDLILGPANAGKIGELSRRYLDCLADGGSALLLVPNTAARERVEEELLNRRSALLGGAVETFDSVFRTIAERVRDGRRQIDGPERRVHLARLLAEVPLESLSRSARGPRFADAVGRLLDRLGSGLVAPEALAAT